MTLIVEQFLVFICSQPNNDAIGYITRWTEKNTKLFWSYLSQNPVNSDKIWYTHCLE